MPKYIRLHIAIERLSQGVRLSSGTAHQSTMESRIIRRARGRKEIDAMEKIAKARLEDDYDEFAADVDLILRKYQ